jgi:hypothetical protein
LIRRSNLLAHGVAHLRVLSRLLLLRHGRRLLLVWLRSLLLILRLRLLLLRLRWSLLLRVERTNGGRRSVSPLPD